MHRSVKDRVAPCRTQPSSSTDHPTPLQPLLRPQTCMKMFAARWPTPFAAVRHAAAPAKLRSQVSPHLPSSLRSNVFGRTVCTTTTATHTAHSTSFLCSYRLAIALALPAGALTLGALGGSAPHKPVLECASAERAYATAPAPPRAYLRLTGGLHQWGPDTISKPLRSIARRGRVDRGREYCQYPRPQLRNRQRNLRRRLC